MLRRYLIVNAVTTLFLYAAVYALLPSTPNLVQSAWASLEAYASETPLLGPLVHRIVLVGL